MKWRNGMKEFINEDAVTSGDRGNAESGEERLQADWPPRKDRYIE